MLYECKMCHAWTDPSEDKRRAKSANSHRRRQASATPVNPKWACEGQWGFNTALYASHPVRWMKQFLQPDIPGITSFQMTLQIARLNWSLYKLQLIQFLFCRQQQLYSTACVWEIAKTIHAIKRSIDVAELFFGWRCWIPQRTSMFRRTQLSLWDCKFTHCSMASQVFCLYLHVNVSIFHAKENEYS